MSMLTPQATNRLSMSTEHTIDDVLDRLNSSNTEYILFTFVNSNKSTTYCSSGMEDRANQLLEVHDKTAVSYAEHSSLIEQAREQVKKNLPIYPIDWISSELMIVNLASSIAVEQYLLRCVTSFQQFNCKALCKAWIKLIEPKKQTNYPYNLGDRGKPDWWPNNVRHKEPDHLMKEERITLLVTILRLPGVEITRLRTNTQSCMNQLEKSRLAVLEHMFHVAALEKAFRRRLIGSNPSVYAAVPKLPVIHSRSGIFSNGSRSSKKAAAHTREQLIDLTSPEVEELKPSETFQSELPKKSVLNYSMNHHPSSDFYDNKTVTIGKEEPINLTEYADLTVDSSSLKTDSQLFSTPRQYPEKRKFQSAYSSVKFEGASTSTPSFSHRVKRHKMYESAANFSPRAHSRPSGIPYSPIARSYEGGWVLTREPSLRDDFQPPFWYYPHVTD